MLRSGTVVDATLISAPSSTKNASGERDPEMRQSKKGQQWFFGMKAHIGVDADSVWSTPCAAHRATSTMWSKPTVCCTGKRRMSSLMLATKARTNGQTPKTMCSGVAMRPGLRKLLDKADPMDALTDQVERIKASIRAKVEHPFRVIKRQFGHVKVRYRGLAKNTAQLHTLFALANLWMVRKRLTGSLA